MILELVLGTISLCLCGLLAWEKNENKKERAKWINAFISKTPEQYRDLELTEKVKPITPPVKTEPDLIPENEAGDKQFEDFINKEIA